MATDLEDELRAALHARGTAITAEMLRSGDGPPRHIGEPAGLRWARVAPILAAAAVAALALAIVLVRGIGSPHRDQPAVGQPATLPALAGHAWFLTSVRAPSGATTSIGASVSASISFQSAVGRLEFDDGVSAFRSAYTVVGTGSLRLAHIVGRELHYGGHDAAQLAAIAAMDAIGDSRPSSTSGLVGIRIASGHLYLTTHGYRLTFSVDPSAGPSDLPAASSSVSTTTTAPSSSVSTTAATRSSTSSSDSRSGTPGTAPRSAPDHS